MKIKSLNTINIIVFLPLRAAARGQCGGFRFAVSRRTRDKNHRLIAREDAFRCQARRSGACREGREKGPTRWWGRV